MNNDIFPFEENWNEKIKEKRKTVFPVTSKIRTKKITLKDGTIGTVSGMSNDAINKWINLYPLP